MFVKVKIPIENLCIIFGELIYKKDENFLIFLLKSEDLDNVNISIFDEIINWN